MNNNIIFVGGIHGVGKTTLCNLLSHSLDIKSYSSSKLISLIKNDNISADKKVSNIEENQNVLLSAINKLVQEEKPYLLDGHFCLINEKNKITEVPIGVFENLNIKEIFVLVDDIENILKRLEQRDSKEYQNKLINEFQEREVKWAKEVAKNIGVKCNIIDVKMENAELLGYMQGLIKVI